MNKDKRGELKLPIPIGYLYDGDSVIKDPDMEIQNAVNMVFDAFQRTGSAHGTVSYFKSKGYKFPQKKEKRYLNDGVTWIGFELSHAFNILHNPYYAGVYYYGKKQLVWTPEGKKSRIMPREDWHVFIEDHHIPYITIEEFETNTKILEENYTVDRGLSKRDSPREGSALIQGMVWCGKCGNRMTVKYCRHVPYYECKKSYNVRAEDICQSINGQGIDKKITELLLLRLTPDVVEQTISIQKELDKRQDESLSYYRMRVDKCGYEVDNARRRFLNVDPDNRLVALELESSWNAKLKALDDAKNEFDHQIKKSELAKSERDYKVLDNLTDGFAELFCSDTVSNKDKKRMVSYLIEDVTLNRSGQSICIQIRYKGQTTQSIEIDAPKRSFETWTTSSDIIKIIDNAAETSTAEDIAELLNRLGHKTGRGNAFTQTSVNRLMRTYSIPNVEKRLLDQGYITSAEKAASMGISASGLALQIRDGRYNGVYTRINSNNECLFPPEQERSN